MKSESCSSLFRVVTTVLIFILQSGAYFLINSQSFVTREADITEPVFMHLPIFWFVSSFTLSTEKPIVLNNCPYFCIHSSFIRNPFVIIDTFAPFSLIYFANPSELLGH